MMKKIIYIFIFTWLSSLFLIAQEQQGSLRDRILKKQQTQETQRGENKSNLPRLSLRAEKRSENNTQNLSNATWVREVYRSLDLTKGTNAALFYPETPIGDRMNLYTLIFKLVASGELEVYQFNEGRDLFTEEMKLKPEDMFERLAIGYTKEGSQIMYDDYSIPSNEVLGYYVKEAWYFDQSNSILDVKIVAICPVIYRDALGDYGITMSMDEAIKEPQFWIPYENIRPYAARMPIITSDINNAMNKTVDDYFRLRLYDGEIYKTTNMANKLLMEIYKTPEELKQAQEKIEQQLVDFDEGLWVMNDTIKVSDGDPKNRNIKKRDQPSQGSDKATYSARERRTKF